MFILTDIETAVSVERMSAGDGGSDREDVGTTRITTVWEQFTPGGSAVGSMHMRGILALTSMLAVSPRASGSD